MIATLNNHVLFPDCDWQTPPQWAREWQTEFSDAVDGKGSRLALRSVARHSLTFLVTPRSQNETAQLEDALRQAKKFGLACAPFWGRGCRLAASFTGDTLECGRGWDWTAGDYIHFQNNSGYEISTVATANYNGGTGLWTLELDDVLTGTYRAHARPMLFGKFTCGEVTAKSAHHGPVTITISELTNARSVQIGVTPVAPAGIGTMAIGSTFQIA